MPGKLGVFGVVSVGLKMDDYHETDLSSMGNSEFVSVAASLRRKGVRHGIFYIVFVLGPMSSLLLLLLLLLCVLHGVRPAVGFGGIRDGTELGRMGIEAG